jgi:hypothetical protein
VLRRFVHVELARLVRHQLVASSWASPLHHHHHDYKNKKKSICIGRESNPGLAELIQMNEEIIQLDGNG